MKILRISICRYVGSSAIRFPKKTVFISPTVHKLQLLEHCHCVQCTYVLVIHSEQTIHRSKFDLTFER